MDPVIISAIIGAIALILAAVISILKRQKRSVVSPFEKSHALRLGFRLSLIGYALEMKEKGAEVSDHVKMLSKEVQRCNTIASAIGIKLSTDPERVRAQAEREIESKSITTQKAFRIGLVVGMTYFMCINYIAALAYLHKPIDDELVKIASDTLARIERESLIEDASLPNNFLAPVKKLWQEIIGSALDGKGDPSKAGHDMDIVIDKLCKQIEDIG